MFPFCVASPTLILLAFRLLPPFRDFWCVPSIHVASFIHWMHLPSFSLFPSWFYAQYLSVFVSPASSYYPDQSRRWRAVSGSDSIRKSARTTGQLRYSVWRLLRASTIPSSCIIAGVMSCTCHVHRRYRFFCFLSPDGACTPPQKSDPFGKFTRLERRYN